MGDFKDRKGFFVHSEGMERKDAALSADPVLHLRSCRSLASLRLRTPRLVVTGESALPFPSTGIKTYQPAVICKKTQRVPSKLCCLRAKSKGQSDIAFEP